MAQVYLSNYVGIIRQTNSSDWSSYPASSDEITEFTSKTTAQNTLIIDYADNNKEIYQDMKLIPDGTDYIAYDVSGAAPTTGDQVYLTRFVALYREVDSGPWSVYTGSGTTIVFSTDSATFLNTLKQEYGIGRYRVFQKLSETSTHGFELVP